MNLLPFVKAELQSSNTRKDHPFRYFYFSTLDTYPETRMVVSRGVSQELEVIFYTDSRTPKVDQIRKNDKVSALFYHPAKQLQLRMNGKAHLIDKNDPSYAQHLNMVKSNANWKQDYASQPVPGVPRKDEGTIIYGNTIHLLVIKIEPIELDIVLLGEQQHHRSKCTLKNGVWEETGVVP
ncbi:MAG: pyridoxamine 5'-phosphate oxidase family protein [Bacteroidota bacterium]